ncbi:MAG: leucine-rich repeat domain-containing protein, partial [Clostridia bacterium]|nr:leucine-rich repeat domain-containing protein [Clostridia bacterium]
FQIANTSTNADNYIEIDYSYSFSNSRPNVDVFPGDENDQSVWENNEYILAPKGATPADGDYETFTLKFKVLDKELNVPQDTKVNVTIALKHTTPSVGTLADGKLTTPDGIIYRVDANGTASLGSTITEGEYLIAEGDNYSYDGEADVVIAPVVSDGTNNYIVTVIDRYAFAYCNDAEGMPDGNAVMQSIHIPNSVKEIKEDAFLFCDELVSVNIPKSVSSIEDLIFYGTSLSEIYIPSSVTSIGNEAFCTCSSLTTIIIPSSVTSIGDNAFSSCSSLTTITIPSSVTSIGGNAFSYTGLTTITIPSSVTSIGRYAFSGCTNLTSVKFEETSGWWYADSADATSGTEIAESEFTTDASAANANLLKTTYYNKYWFRTVA